MKQWLTEVLMPYAERCIEQHRLHSDAAIILMLDVWAVHKSEEFRLHVRNKHPRIHLVFVPANCTSKLQVADVALQRPFKHGITTRFNQWAAEQIREQVNAQKIVGLAESLKMKTIKPLALSWCVESWLELRDRTDLILTGWQKCCTLLFNVHDPAKRVEALAACAQKKLDYAHVPGEDEQDSEPEFSDSDSDHDELDISKPVTIGKRTGRNIPPREPPLHQRIDSSAIMMTSDSD
jgi:hypothetical protein